MRTLQLAGQLAFLFCIITLNHSIAYADTCPNKFIGIGSISPNREGWEARLDKFEILKPLKGTRLTTEGDITLTARLWFYTFAQQRCFAEPTITATNKDADSGYNIQVPPIPSGGVSVDRRGQGSLGFLDVDLIVPPYRFDTTANIVVTASWEGVTKTIFIDVLPTSTDPATVIAVDWVSTATYEVLLNKPAPAPDGTSYMYSVVGFLTSGQDLVDGDMTGFKNVPPHSRKSMLRFGTNATFGTPGVLTECVVVRNLDNEGNSLPGIFGDCFTIGTGELIEPASHDLKAQFENRSDGTGCLVGADCPFVIRFDQLGPISFQRSFDFRLRRYSGQSASGEYAYAGGTSNSKTVSIQGNHNKVLEISDTNVPEGTYTYALEYTPPVNDINNLNHKRKITVAHVPNNYNLSADIVTPPVCETGKKLVFSVKFMNAGNGVTPATTVQLTRQKGGSGSKVVVDNSSIQSLDAAATPAQVVDIILEDKPTASGIYQYQFTYVPDVTDINNTDHKYSGVFSCLPSG